MAVDLLAVRHCSTVLVHLSAHHHMAAHHLQEVVKVAAEVAVAKVHFRGLTLADSAVSVVI